MQRVHHQVTSRERQSQPRCPEKSLDVAKSPSHYCTICKLTFASNKSLRNHNSGSRHRKKAKTIERVKKAFYCEVCRIELSSEKQLQQHLGGKNHRKRVMGQRADMEGEISSVKDCESFKLVSHHDSSDSSLLGRSAPRSSTQEFVETYQKGTSLDKDGHTEDRIAQVSSSAVGSDVENQQVILETLLQSKMFSAQFIRAANLEAYRLLEAQAQTGKPAENKKEAKEVCSPTASSNKQLKEHLKRVRYKADVLNSNGDQEIDQAHSRPDPSSKGVTKQEPDDSDEMIDKSGKSSQELHQSRSCDVKTESTSCSQNKRELSEDLPRQTTSERNALPLVRNVDIKWSPSDSSKQHKGFPTRSSSRSPFRRDSGHIADTKAVKSNRREKLHRIDDKTFPDEKHAHRHLRGSLSRSEARQERNIHRESTFKPSRVQADEQKETTRKSDSPLETRQGEMGDHCGGKKREIKTKSDALQNTDSKHSPSDSSKQCRGSSTGSSSMLLSELDTCSRQVAVKSDRKGKLHDKTFVAKEHSHRHLRSSLSGSKTRKGEQKVHWESTSKTGSQMHSHDHKDNNRNVRRNSDSQLEIRGREGEHHQGGTVAKTGKSNSRRHYFSDDLHPREHYTRQAKRGLISGSEARQVHEGDCRGSTSTLHTEGRAQDEDERRLNKRGFLGLEDVQRNAEMRGSNGRGPHVPTELSERSFAAQTHRNVWMKHANCEVDPVLRNKSHPKLRVGPEASSSIWDRNPVVYDYNHGLDESLDENTSKQLPSLHQTAKTSAQTLSRYQFDTGNEIGRHKRSQDEGDVLDHRALAKKQRVLGSLSGASVPGMQIKTESESDDDDVQNLREHHASGGQEGGTTVAKKGPSRPGGSPTTQPQKKKRVTNASEKPKKNKVEQSRHANSLRKQERAPSKKESGKSDEQDTGSKSKRARKGSGMQMLPLEHLEKQRAKVLKIINLGTQHEVENLNGVGKKRARMIIQWRQAVGGFKHVEELSNILGFGEKMLTAILL